LNGNSLELKKTLKPSIR